MDGNLTSETNGCNGKQNDTNRTSYLRIGEGYFHVEACSRGAIATAISLSQLMGYMTFSVFMWCNCDNDAMPNTVD